MNDRLLSLPALPLIRLLLAQTKIFSSEQRKKSFIPDTNILLDLLYWKDPRVKQLNEAIQAGEMIAVYSEETLAEFADVLSRKPFSLTLGDTEKLIREALRFGVIATDPEQACPIRCKDPDDQKFINLAFFHHIPLILSRDKLVLKTNRKLSVHGIRVTEDLDSVIPAKSA